MAGEAMGLRSHTAAPIPGNDGQPRAPLLLAPNIPGSGAAPRSGRLTMPSGFTEFPNFAPFPVAPLLSWDGVDEMTAMLRELRDLDNRLDRGIITQSEYALRRQALIESVDDASTGFIKVAAAPARKPPTATRKRNSASTTWGLGTIICLFVVGACLLLSELLFANLNLALPLGVTVLAALTVALLRSLEE